MIFYSSSYNKYLHKGWQGLHLVLIILILSFPHPKISCFYHHKLSSAFSHFSFFCLFLPSNISFHSSPFVKSLPLFLQYFLVYNNQPSDMSIFKDSIITFWKQAAIQFHSLTLCFPYSLQLSNCLRRPILSLYHFIIRLKNYFWFPYTNSLPSLPLEQIHLSNIIYQMDSLFGKLGWQIKLPSPWASFTILLMKIFGKLTCQRREDIRILPLWKSSWCMPWSIGFITLPFAQST